MSFIIHKLLKHDFIKKGHKVLDFGGGNGKHSLPLIKEGCEVTILDRFNLPNKQKGLTVVECDMREYKTSQKFDVILAINSLPFLSSKDEIITAIDFMQKHLKKGGIIVFTLFGIKHEWNGQSKRIFNTAKEVSEIIEGFDVYSKREELGYVITMDGTKTFWHAYELWVQNI